MNVNTIVIPAEIAKAKLAEYRADTAALYKEEDTKLRTLYKSVLKGAKVIDICEAFKTAGLNIFGQPKLAIARADSKDVWFRNEGYPFWCPSFSVRSDFDHRYSRHYTPLPKGIFGKGVTDRTIHSLVPHMPPSVRPKFKLENYHILFEVEKWDVYPVDPFLLRRIEGHLYVIEAEWELTPLEASLLSSLRGS